MLGPNQQKWVDALRSGDFPQCDSLLCSGETYCCMGVLSVIAGCERTTDENGDIFFDEENILPPLSAREFVALKNAQGNIYHPDYTSLIDMNDAGIGFSRIAYMIEKYSGQLFKEVK